MFVLIKSTPIVYFNPLSPNSNKHLISPHIIATQSSIEEMRKRKQLRKIKCLDIQAKSPSLPHMKFKKASKVNTNVYFVA